MTAPAPFSLLHDAPTDRDALPLPSNGPYFVPSKNGYMVHRDFHFGRVLVPIKETTLPEHRPYLWPEINVPAELIGQAWSFFRAIWHARHSEAMVDITWSPEKGYRLFCPPQRASSGGVQADRKLEHYRGQMVGTIHSHCNFGAFHSGTDTHDADGHDGLHVTLGKNDQDQPEQAIMISVGGLRWDFEPKELWGEVLPLIPHPRWWEKQVRDPAPHNSGHVSTWRREMGLTSAPTSAGNTPKPSVITSTPKPVTPTSIVASITTRRPHQRPNWANNFTSIDEMLWTIGTELTKDENDGLEAINELIDEITKALDSLGYDFDYTVEEQTNSGPALLSGPYDHWFGQE
jgi:hypothetical protein